MQVTSFHKALLGLGGAVGLAGGTAGLLLWRADRRGDDEAAYRAREMPVDEFVDRAIADYDQETYGSPLEAETYGNYDPDGVLTIGPEDQPTYDATLYREFVEDVDGHDDQVSAQRFLVAADVNEDGNVTRSELRTAVDAHAGGDGTLSSSERRTVMVEEGLGEVVSNEDRPPRTSWEEQGYDYDSREIRTAYDAALDVTGALDPGSERHVGGHRAIRLDAVEASMPWSYERKLGSGPIRSALPVLAGIDARGNGDGLVSAGELAPWVAEEFRSERHSPGHVTATEQEILKRVQSQLLGRIEADTLQGHAYLNPRVPKGDIDRFYGGDLAAYLDSIEGVRTARGSVPWQPDPRARG